MKKIGKQLYADNFQERSEALRKAQPFCSWCHRVHGQESTSDIVQLSLKGLKRRGKRKKRKIVLIAHHPNYDTENPDAELIILCRACHGKAQKLHNAEVYEAKQKETIRDEVQTQKKEGQLQLALDDTEYPTMQVDFSISQFLQSVPSKVSQ